ncbi:MBG domain-containing protein [Flavisolibacter tropicus]|uniref:Ig-like domain-containing protein n=1 Tax=Flavisolibacter tropicus TaxID=1492898 RepID=A0A172U0Y7_9BACT|nr:MBG domain-containing protein [Flavisolibacter tropicus]ANE52980.1 hypothetical protein SY85_23395 [Flavisolibacter tropicus]
MRNLYPLARRLRIVAKTISSRLSLFFLLFGLSVVSANAQTTRYVNASASGANDGTSWADAYNDLQAALNSAVSGDAIKVAAGTYMPSVDPDGTGVTRKQTFMLKSGVELLGGYNATTGVRDVKANKTILSGDLDNNDVGLTNNTNNAYHVVAAKNLGAATLLDGFTISGGNANNQSTTFLVDGDNGLGGAVYMYGASTNLTINNCVIENNYSINGVVAILRSSSPLVTNCVFSANSATSGGAVQTNSGSGTSSFVNCLFVRNTAAFGSSFDTYGGNISLVNCTFYKNTATVTSSGYEGTVRITSGSTLTMVNSVVWGNTKAGNPDGIAIHSSGGSGTVSYSTMDAAGSGYTGSNNLNTDPAFNNAADPDGADNIWMTADDGLHLRAASPSTNTGNDGGVSIATDIIGAARKQGVVNRGAYETVMPAVTLYVDASASGLNDGTTWTNAYTNLQSALAVAVSGDKVLVAAGTYTPSVDPDGTGVTRKQTFMLKSGVELLGGYNATTGVRDVKANKTILSGDLDNNDVGLTNNTNNAYHVVAAKNLGAATLLDGFTISGGNANNQSTTFLVDGDNGLGGAVYMYGASTNLTINNCVIENNYSINGVVAILRSSSPLVTNCVFSANSATSGGAVQTNSGSGTSSFVNCLFVRNTAAFGSSFDTYGGNISLVNCTFYKNTATVTSSGYEGTVRITSGSTLTMVNSVVWGNTKAGNPDGIAIHSSGGSGTVSYSTMDAAGSGYTGSNNLNTDPAFNNAADPDGADNIWMTADDGLHLNNPSPAADQGDNSAVSGIATDITGATRIQNGTVNMGAYETVVTKTPQTVSFTAGATVTKIYGDAYTVSATASSGLSITYTIISGPATISGSAITFTGTGSVEVKAVQSGNATYDPAEATQTITVIKKAVTVTVDAISKTYGDADPTLTYTNTALVTGDAFTGSLKRDAGESVGTYAINQNDLALNSNYTLTFVGADLTIGARSITIKANDASKFVGETKTFTGNEYSISSGTLATGDAITSVSLSSNGEPAIASAGTYPITVGGAAGIPTSNYNITYVDGTLTVNPCTAITIDIPPADQTVCPGGNVTFTVSATGSGMSYQWLKDGAAISSATSSSYTISSVTAGHAANYSVEVSNGCGTVTSSAATLSVNVSTKITAQPVAKSVCETGPASFSVTATGSNLTYQWYKDGSPISSATSSTLSLSSVSAANAGNYSVEVSGDCGNETSASVALTVLPITAISTDPVSKAVCEGGSVSFSGSATGTGIVYKWQKDGSDISGTFSTSYTIATVTAADAGNYRLVATSACGVATSNAATLTVNSIPATPTVGTSSATTFCVGGSVTLTSSATSGNQWFKDGAVIGGATAQTYIATTGGSYTVQSTVSTCPSPVSAGTTVTVNPIPTAPTISAGGALSFCSGGSVTLTSSVASGNQWYNGSTLLTGETGQTYTATTSGNYNVKVTASGCTSTASASTIVTANVTPATPTISTGSSTTFCSGGSVTLTSSAASGNQWYKDGAAIGGATAQTYTATAGGSYTVKATSGSCTSSASAATVVTVNATPATPVITATGNILTSSATAGNQWYLNGTAITGATNQTHRVQASGLYKVKVTSGACSSTSVDYNFVATRIDNPGTGNGEIFLYPNPVLKTLTVKNAAGHKLLVRIYDGFGKKVHESKLVTSQGSIDVQGLSAGIYQVVVTDQASADSKPFTYTIVKL